MLLSSITYGPMLPYTNTFATLLLDAVRTTSLGAFK